MWSCLQVGYKLGSLAGSWERPSGRWLVIEWCWLLPLVIVSGSKRLVSACMCLEQLCWNSWLGKLWTALTFWHMKMTVKHDKDDNLMSRAEESGTSFLKSYSYIGRTPKGRQDTKRVIVHFFVLQVPFLARGRRFKISCEVILRSNLTWELQIMHFHLVWGQWCSPKCWKKFIVLGTQFNTATGS